MKFILMRMLDRHVGNFIIALLVVFKFIENVFGYVAGLFFKLEKEPVVVKKILIQKYFGVGSIINGIPMIEALRKRFPEAKIIIVTFAAQKKFLDIVNCVDEVISIDNNVLKNFVLDLAKAIVKIKMEKIDVSVDLEFFSRFSMIMSIFSAAKIRVGFYSPFASRGKLLTHPVGFNHYKHISRDYLAMAEALGAHVLDHGYSINLPSLYAKHQKELEELLGGVDEAPIVSINVNASELCDFRKWPIDSYAELINETAKEHENYKYVLIGAPNEFEYVQSVFDRLDEAGRAKTLNLAGKTSYGSLMALLEKSFLLISNDSGPVHIAAGYKTNTLVIFGPETPILYRPLNPNAVVIYKHPYCSPCLNVLDNKSFEHCEDLKCLNSVSVQDVRQHLEKHFFSNVKSHEQSE